MQVIKATADPFLKGDLDLTAFGKNGKRNGIKQIGGHGDTSRLLIQRLKEL